MPTFSTVALETLIQPKPKNSSTTPPPLLKQQQPQIHHLDSSKDESQEQSQQQQRRQHQQRRILNPALYATPQPTPILDSSTALSGSVSPSPYVFNRKGRGGRGRNTTSSVNRKIDGFEIDQQRKTDFASEENDVEVVDVNFVGDEMCVTEEEEDGDFLDPRGGLDSSSVASSNDFGSGRRVDTPSPSLVSNHGEFFDADEDFSSDGSVSSVLTCGRSIELELRATRLSLFEEIEKRKTAEDALGMMQSLWQRVASLLLSQTGLTFPVPSNSTAVQLEMSSLVQFSQEVIVARFVSEAIGKGEARAEAELAAEVIIDAKDQEISRLRDRLQYYEAMNREMSQRNIEVMEVARRERTRRRGQRRWLWSCLGISVVIGASVIAYSCLPPTSEHHMLPGSSSQSDSSCISSSESS